jgi:ferric-chelate reductase
LKSAPHPAFHMASQPDFHAVATPKPNEPLHIQRDVDEVETPSKLALVAHWTAGALLAFSVFSITVIFTPMVTPITTDFLNPLWNVNPKIKNSGRPEMVNDSYFFFGVILPIVVAFLLVRLVSKGASFPVPGMSHMLKRKPRIFGSLVSYGEILFLLVVIGGNIIFYYYYYSTRIKPNSKTKDKIKLAAKTLGLATMYNMVWLALPASRHCFWMEWLGIPFAHAVKYHRWLGVATILCATLHTAFYIQVYVSANDAMTLLPCFGCDVAKEGKMNWVNTFGWIAFWCMVVMGLTSLPYVRRHYYKVFYATHFLFIPATAFAIMHYANIAIYLFATIVLYIGNRMMSSATIQAPVVVQKAVAHPHDVTELTFECATSYHAGDVVYIKVPSVSQTQWHPFSVASTPLHTPGSITVYIKSLGEWSGQVHEYIRQCTASGVDPVVYMDGGYVSPAPVSASYEKVVFVGGGIGVTPLLGQIMHTLHSQSWQDVHLVWHVRDVRMMAQFQQWFHEATSLSSHLHLHLFVTQTSPASEITSRNHVFDLKSSNVAPRPYANVSTLRQVLLFVAAFFGAGSLFVAVHYNNKITTADPSYWPLQRLMEFLAIVIGAYWAYVVVLVKPYTPVPVARSQVDEYPKEPMMSTEAFVERYNVQQGHMDWSRFFAGLADSTAASASIGVFVSGPKTLLRAIEAETHALRFDLHHEEFEM